jgi:cardiolipin synthase A/B
MLDKLSLSKEMRKQTDYQEKILIDHDYFTALIADIHAAKQSIDLSTYIFSDDSLGKRIANELVQAAKRGVKVRVLMDGVGSRVCSATLMRSMEEAGIHVRIFHPLPWMIWQWSNAAHVPRAFLQKFFYVLTKINSRNHRKLCLIDRSIIYISSANIDQCHLSKAEGGQGWRDTAVRITNLKVGVSTLRKAFNRAWHHLPINRKVSETSAATQGENIFNLNSTRKQRRQVYRKLLARIYNCKERIWITNPYFLPDSYLLRALKTAAERHVDIRILLPAYSDVWISKLVANTFYSSLLKSGVTIYEYSQGILHAKIFIIDDWYSIGSSNLNTRSLKHDLELDVSLQTEVAKSTLEKQFLKDCESSIQIQLSDLKRQSYIKTLFGRLLLFLRYWI